jgi:hypothetical protein
MIVTRAEVGRMLVDWEAASVSAAEVHGWAERHYAVADRQPEDQVVNEVLARLDMLDIDLIVAADVPALRRLLESMPARLPDALNEYEAYVDSIDLRRRRQELAGDPFYGPFCNSTGALRDSL